MGTCNVERLALQAKLDKLLREEAELRRVFRKIAARREQIAQEITEIQEQLLRDVKPFRLKPDLRLSRSRARGKNKFKGGEKPNGETA